MRHLERGHTFEGRYKIQRELGRGGFGTVYQARQLGMERDVAIKILTVDIEGEAALTARERFLREVRITSKLRHPNTVTIHDFGQTQDGTVYMVLEYVDGETLKDLVKRRGALEEARAIKIAHQIARSLSEAHRHGIIHRDLKPQNIMLTELGGEQDFVKVLDFGIARFRNRDDGKDLTNTGNPNERELIGTPRYMSPEQVRGEEITGCSDVYSLGLMCYEMLAGEPAVQGTTMMALITQQVSHEPLAMPHLQGLHPIIQQIITKATHKSLHYRHRTVDLLADELEHALTELKRERTSSDFLVGNQYDATPAHRQTGPLPQIPLQSHQHATGQHAHITGQMNAVLMSNAPPAAPPQHHVDENAETNLQLEPLSAQMMQSHQGSFVTGNHPPAHASHVTPSVTPDAPSFPQDLPPLPDEKSPFESTIGVRAPNKLPPLHPDEEEADASYVFALVLTGVLTLGLIAASYTAFLLIGSAVGVLIEGNYRFIVTCIIMALLVGLPIATEIGRKERFQVMYNTLYRIKRIVSISFGLCVGTCILVSLTLPEKVITRLEGQPNWFFEEPEQEDFFHLKNAQYSLQLASVMRSSLTAIGLVEMKSSNRDLVQPKNTPAPTRPSKGDALPIKKKTLPAPTRPATQKLQRDTETKKKPKKTRPSPQKKKDQYETW